MPARWHGGALGIGYEAHGPDWVELGIDYESTSRPATPGRRIIRRGECYRVTRSVGFVRGIAHDGDGADPVAHVTGTFMFTD